MVNLCFYLQLYAPVKFLTKNFNFYLVLMIQKLLVKNLFAHYSKFVCLQKSKMSNLINKNNIVWVDLEMTGLNIDKDQIIEMACLITDDQLNIIAESQDFVIHHSDETLENMSEWCINQFKISGLTELSRNSKMTLEDVENNMVEFIKKYTPTGSSPLAGNSVHMDKIFLNKYMKNFMEHLHYRIIDVSSLKELCKRWNPEVLKKVPMKKSSHRALGDIRESVEELKFYRKNFIKE